MLNGYRIYKVKKFFLKEMKDQNKYNSQQLNKSKQRDVAQ